MPAYAIVRAEITNANRFKDYVAATPSLLEKYGARFLARGGEVSTLEGAEENRRIVIIEYPSREKALQFYHSNEYAKLLEIMKESGVRDFILVDGID